MALAGEPQVGTRTVWQLDTSHTMVEFQVRHMMVTTVRGRFAGVQGTLVLDEANLANSSVEVEIDAASLDTLTEQRNNHLRSADFLDVANYPKITFKSTKVEPLGDDRLIVTGDLTIRSITRPVALDVTNNGRGTSPWGTQVIGFSAETSINRHDFGASWNVALEAGGVLVGEKVRILIEAEAVKQG
ncbi:MAG: polyisoprenoid-binding protein [Chloroflexi bacterium]|nr:polyisoprenoid-binding protein [Chloroflexota bacterium]